METITQTQELKSAFDLTKSEKVRVRMAPSPTGPLHIGTARTALFNYLFAKKHQGVFVMRIEDTDKERSKKEWENGIINGLKWLGIGWQEGPDIGGIYKPYRQSERKEVYKKYIKKLIDEKKAFYCFCSQKDLEAHRQFLMSMGKPAIYEGKCSKLSEQEAQKKFEQGKPYVIRLRTELKKIVFNDMLRGEIEYDTRTFGEIVVAKNLEEPLYNLAVVIDDFEMNITHIIRGEDHIPNTPKQIAIAEALNIVVPRHLHLPLILGPDKSKMSKRHGTVDLDEYKKQGFLPEAMVNFMAFLGWNPGTNEEIFSMDSLIKEFSVEKIQKSGAIFNENKLLWLNGFYIRQKPLNELTELCMPFLKEHGITGESEKIKQAIAVNQERLKKLSEIPELVDYFFKDKLSFELELLRWKNMKDKEIKQALDKSMKVLSKVKEGQWNKENLTEILLKEAEKIGDRGELLWPLRVALTGKKASATPFDVAEILGKEQTLERIREAKKLF